MPRALAVGGDSPNHGTSVNKKEKIPLIADGYIKTDGCGFLDQPVLRLTACFLLPPPGFRYRPGHVRKLPVTWGEVMHW